MDYIYEFITPMDIMEKIYERGFTIIKDPRFVDENNERWPKE